MDIFYTMGLTKALYYVSLSYNFHLTVGDTLYQGAEGARDRVSKLSGKRTIVKEEFLERLRSPKE